MDRYIAAARSVAAEQGVPVCDVYALWQTLRASGVKVTDLLANHLNHPDKDMHWLFAFELVKMMLS